MNHREVLETNTKALRATYERLSSREDLDQDEQNKVMEVKIILESLEKVLTEYES